MAKAKTVWGIDIGHCALKAIKLRSDEEGLQIAAFDVIEHPKILSQPDADRPQLIRTALEQFLARNSVAGCKVAVSLAGQRCFPRFVKLPPVEDKRIPDIVKYEASQQIPFPIEEVIWQWQKFHDPDSPDVEVGIFAVKRTDVQAVLDQFSQVEIGVDIVQVAPLALYNFMRYDEQCASDGATLLADVGADKTDLVVADGQRMWTRTIQIGGNSFTDALVRALNVPFAKAEKYKRTAGTSKYARQIFQAMRPVFADLMQDIQRSIGYYTTLHREARFKKLIGMGNGFQLPGLHQFLEQSLNLPVVRLDSYNKLSHPEGSNASGFTANVLAFPVAYGLALQGLTQTEVSFSMMPTEVARKRLWAQKNPVFIGAAAAILAAMALPIVQNVAASSSLASGESAVASAQAVVREQQDLTRRKSGIDSKAVAVAKEQQKLESMFAYRDYWPSLQSWLSGILVSQLRDQTKLQEYNAATSDSQRAEVLDKLAADRQNREYFIIEQVKAKYVEDLAAVDFSGAASTGGGAAPSGAGRRGGPGPRGFIITITGWTPLNEQAASAKLADIYRAIPKMDPRVQDDSKLPFRVFDKFKQLDGPVRPAAGGGTPGAPGVGTGSGAKESTDPLFPDDKTDHDQRFTLILKVSVVDAGKVGAPTSPRRNFD